MADPKFRFYRVRHTNEVMPALRTPAGYEDDHPGDFEGVPDDQVPQELLDKLSRKDRTSTVGQTEGSSSVSVLPTPAVPLPPNTPPVVVAGQQSASTPAAPAAPIPPAPAAGSKGA